jgi:arylsulfatase A-like enzyme
VRAHPIVRSACLLLAFRLGSLAIRYAAQSQGSVRDRLALFLPAAIAHAGVIALVCAAFLLLDRVWPRARRAIATVAAMTFGVLMVAGLADLIVSTITGAPLTPTVFRTYRGLRVVRSNEFLEPLRANAAATIAGAVAFTALVLWMARLLRQDARTPARPAAPLVVVTLAVGGLAACAVPGIALRQSPAAPIEWAFAREYLHLDHTTLREREPDAIAHLRDTIGLPAGAEWLTPEFPLAYRWRQPTAVERRPPDIVVVMVESLRAEELELTTREAVSASPNLDALAARSVVFPTFISNGFPSAPSVLAFHCSAWPHRRKEIITDFADRGFDSIPGRLRTLGFETIYVGADPHFDNQSQWLPRWYSTAIDLVQSGVVATDRAIVGRAIDEIRRHDARGDSQPLFAFVSTYSTHYPFTLPEDAGESPDQTSLKTKYRQVLRYTDRQIGGLIAFLSTRARRDRTVTIVVGDHAFYTDLGQTSGLPENDNVWTTAIVNGPTDLVGPPRRVVEPASHVDMLPTILALTGDRRPSAALGADLFGAARSAGRSALAVRPGGWRFDTGSDSVMVDARAPNIAARRVAFPSLRLPIVPDAHADVGVDQLTDLVDAWSYLIEHDRVWSDALLGRPPATAESQSGSRSYSDPRTRR